ncbi:MAG: glycosyltransferase [Oscillospiraceae bacterium]|nr:glycosyltransferase [Oscillospiraceae bacterium]
MSRPGKIDVIIPVYNALDDLVKCIESVVKNTDMAKHRLILVNDASSDERIMPYIKSLESDSILVVENESNMGFSATVNHGIEISYDRDVILLNSDTIVTAGWVEKIINCAYSDRNIATVTPLSNNATLCSVPDFLMENKLPRGYTLDEYATLVEKTSMKLYPRIPVAHGFCMFIKREVFDRIGLFDARTFEKGYGEENDFCYRAIQLGYSHVMCDDTYIYHTGSTSFVSEDKRKLMEAHQRILIERYPDLDMDVALHCRTNPNEAVQDNVKIQTALNNGRKNLLYLVQSDFRKDANDHLGGTQLHVKDMMTVMRHKYNVFVAARNGDYLNLTAYLDEEEIVFRFYLGRVPAYAKLRDQKTAQLYGRILDAFSIDMVHIHHTKDMTVEMFYRSAERNIPLVATLHDYYTVCPFIKMMDCMAGECISTQQCNECIAGHTTINPSTDYASFWRKEHLRALSNAEALFVPSEFTKKVIGSYYPEITEKIQVIPHGIGGEKIYSSTNEGDFNIAFVGGISKEKGSYISSQLIKNSPKNVHWFLFGISGNNELSSLDRKNYTKTGPYEREELQGLLLEHKIDLVCILSRFRETYCYTLSEAVNCSIPVIATDIGALGERMRRDGFGWLVSMEDTYNETMRIIERIKNRGEEYARKKEIAEKYIVKNLWHMGESYMVVYDGLMQNTQCEHYSKSWDTYKFITDAHRVAKGKKISIEADGEQIQERLEELENRMNSITSSFTYKVANGLRRLPVPGKAYIKKAVYKIHSLLKRK